MLWYSSMTNAEPQLDLNYEPSPEEMERYVIDEVIFPALLARLNQAKIDLNTARSAHTDDRERAALLTKYVAVLKDGGRIINDVELPKGEKLTGRFSVENLITDPKMAAIFDHDIAVTIEWLEIMGDNIGNIVRSGVSLGESTLTRIERERQNLQDISRVSRQRLVTTQQTRSVVESSQ